MSTPSDVHQHFTHQPPVTGHQPAPPIPEASGGAETTTLLVRHLPEAIPYDMLCRLFSYYGASSVRPCSGASLRNCAFVDFKDETLASHAQAQLNRLRFHKKVLSVERVHSSVSNNMNQQGLKRSLKEASCLSAPPLNDSHSSGSKNSTTLTSGSTRSEPIAPKLGVDYMFPPHLEYDYPPPDGNILTNIVNALIAVPRFYTQVLHLMNKMNIPAPFRMALPTPPLHPPIPAPAPPPPPTSEKPPSNDMSSDESEWESSEEDAVDGVQSRKRAKRKAIVGPGIDKGVAHEDVGLKPASLVPKELPVIKKRHSVLPIKLASKTSHTETRDLASSAAVTATDPSDIMEAKPFATPQEIERGKLPQEEILSLPMFKAYAAGDPNTVLYIKNLAKDVVPDDFYFIFGSLFGSLETARAGLGVKLMQEGRMRGQAFVTFPSIALAQRGLNLVHGYVFKGKPIVIQFGRQSK